MNTLTLTIVGNLTDAPELRYVPSGAAVCKFTVAHTPRTKKGDEWTDGEPTFLDCTAWRQLAENIAESLTKGARVIVTGRLRTERWDDKESGQKRSRVVLDADAVGAELAYATASVKKMARSNGGPADDPWSTASKNRPEPAAVPAGSADTSRDTARQAGWDEEPPF